MNIDYISFNKREKRTRYIFDNFQKYFGSRILDVGCDKAVLKTMIKDIEYTGIDIGGTPDICINLEKIDTLPFEDNMFDCVICADVLEHLDNLHQIFAELIRVSKKHLIIAWPNNWVNARIPMQRGYGEFEHYGLPVDKPVDRHKWFFNLTQAKDFISQHSQSYKKIELVEERATEKPKNIISRFFRRLRYPAQQHYLNRYANTYWTILKKTN